MASSVNSFNSSSWPSNNFSSLKEFPIMICFNQPFDYVYYVICKETLEGNEIFYEEEFKKDFDRNFKTYLEGNRGFQIIVKRPPSPLSNWQLKVFGFFEEKKTYEKTISIEELFKLQQQGCYYFA